MKSDFTDSRRWYSEKMLQDVARALIKRDFNATCIATAEQVVEELLKSIPKSASVGIGGSITIRELGIIERLEQRGTEVIHHWRKDIPKEQDREIRKKEGLADYYLTSANAITKTGDIINIDGIGNRVAHMIYGPDNVFIIAGHNKIVSHIDEGILRSKEIAAVINAHRLSTKTPCATTGKCTDCNSPGRICRVTTILQYRPWQTNIHVMLVNEVLGF